MISCRATLDRKAPHFSQVLWVTICGALAGCGGGGVGGPARPPQHAASFRFVNVAAESGILFQHQIGAQRPLDILRTTGSGLAWLDYDQDGWPDLFCVNEDPVGVAPRARGHRLFRNLGGGRFQDVTDAAGVRGLGQYGMGVAVGDYDGDGFPDLYVTCFGSNHLYHNRRNGTFEDVTEQLGVGGGDQLDGATKWSTGAAWFDADGDGDLDLYVANYCRLDQHWSRLCRFGGRSTACPPTHYAGQRSLFFRNEGKRGFRLDPTLFSLGSRAQGRSLAVLPFDADGDGRPEVFVANDGGGNFFFRKRGEKFVESAYEAGLALDAGGGDPASMGVDAAPPENSETPELVVGNFQDVPNLLFHQERPLFFRDISSEAGLEVPTRKMLTFGALFGDFNLDGKLEILFVNGHVQDNVEQLQPGVKWAQPPALFAREGAGFRLVSDGGPALADPLVARGLALADFDHDGDEDAAVSVCGGRVELWRNDGPHGHWLQVQLRGRAPNTEAIGASVTVKATGLAQTRSILTGRSYLSDSERTLTFGLGNAPGPVELAIRWPSGARTARAEVAVDQRVVIREGAGG